MGRILTSVLGLALLASVKTAGLTAGVLPVQAPRQPIGTGAISGVISDAVTGRPIAGATVNLYGFVNGPDGRPLEPFFWPQVLTDARGRFVFIDLPASHQYTLVVFRSGYAAGEYEGPAVADRDWAVPANSSVPIRLAEGEWMRDANVRLWRLSSISGHVVDERGEPVVGAAVRVFSRQMMTGRERLVPGPLATTDDRGVYRIAYLRPGRFFIAVLSVQATVPSAVEDGARRLPLGGLVGRGSSAPPVARSQAQGPSIDVDGRHRLVLTNFATPPPPGADRPRAYAAVFYPNAPTAEEAQPVELKYGASHTNIDFRLAPVTTVRMSGHVTGAVQDAANMILRLMPQGAEHLGFGSEVATTLVEPDRSFTFLNVPAGVYTLLASPAVAEISAGGSSQGNLPPTAGAGPVRGYSMVYSSGGSMGVMWWRFAAGASGWGRVPISVGNADITGVDVPLLPAGVVRGRMVYDDPAQADPNLRFTVSLEPANGDPLLGLPHATTASGDTSFTFSIAGLQNGRYLFRASPFGGWRVKSVTVRGVDITDAGIEGAPGREYDDVVVTISKTAAELSGFVRDGNGRPATGGVILFPVDSKLWVDYGLSPDRLQSITASRDGSFKLRLIRDGEYYAIAVPRAQVNAWTDPKFLAAAATRATRVSLKAGATTVQNLQVSEVIVK